MKNLTAVKKGIERHLDEKEEVREYAIKTSRYLLRICRSAIHAIHRGQNPEESLKIMKETVEKMKKRMKKHPDVVSSNIVISAFQEVAEAFIFYSVLRKNEMPKLSSVDVPPAAYLLGASDAVGELRRCAQEFLKEDDLKSAEEVLQKMEMLYEFLMYFIYPSAIVAVKPKQDIARALIEKTRSEILIRHICSQ